AFEGGENRRLVSDLGAELIDLFLLVGRLVLPTLHLAVEALLRVLGLLVVLEDLDRVNIADPEIARPDPWEQGQGHDREPADAPRVRLHRRPRRPPARTRSPVHVGDPPPSRPKSPLFKRISQKAFRRRARSGSWGGRFADHDRG